MRRSCPATSSPAITSDRSMTFKWILAPIIAVFLTAAAPITGPSSSDVAGVVPRLLTAVSDKDARILECTLGDAVADAVRVSLGADIAIVNGGDLVRNLLPGEITYDELRASFKEDRPLAVVTVTPMALRGILEAGLSHITLDSTETIDSAASAYDGFPQISGFTLSYDTTAPPGQRVHEIMLGGKPLELEDDVTAYRLAATAFMLGGGYGLPAINGAVPSELKLSDAVVFYLSQEMPDYSVTGSRIYPMGAQNGSLKALLPMGITVIVIFLIVIGNGQRFKGMHNFSR